MKYTIEYTSFRAAVIKVRRSKNNQYRYHVVALRGSEIGKLVYYETNDLLVAQEYARLIG